MATLNRTLLLEDMKFWLPSSNSISDVGLNKICEIVITKLGDDSDNYEEVLCKSLKLAAQKNKADVDANIGNLKKSKLGDLEEQFYSGGVGGDAWQTYLDSLPDICGGFGYIEETPTTESLYGKIGIFYGDKPDPEDEFIEYASGSSDSVWGCV